MTGIGKVVLSAAASAGESYERLFGLDFQLLHDAFWTALAVFILFFALSYLLFNPAREMLKKRKEKVEKDLQDAAHDKEEAARLKAEYDDKLINVTKESHAILDAVQKDAVQRKEAIVNEAKAEAARIVSRAEDEAFQEKIHAMDDVKNEMVELASDIAKKVVGNRIDASVEEALIDETLNAIGEGTWADQ